MNSTAPKTVFNPFIIWAHFYHEFMVWLDDFIDIGKAYADEKINVQSYHNLN